MIAVLCAGAGSRVAVSARARGRPACQCDGRCCAFDLYFSGDRRSGRRRRRDRHRRNIAGAGAALRERIEALLPAGSAISPASSVACAVRFAAALPIAPAPPLLGACGRWTDRRAGAGRPRREAEPRCRLADPAAFAGAPHRVRPRPFTLVGAGPGDPDLLTIKALRALQDADVVFYDELVSPEVLDRARRDAARVPVGSRVGKPGIGQEAINRLLIEARGGQRVVRLKGGDPFVFGRGGEEIDALRRPASPIRWCRALRRPRRRRAIRGAAAFRREALRITFLTAHKARDAETVDWSALTDKKMTVVVYMGMTAAPSVRAGLLAAGRSPQTPVGVFARVTRPDAQAAVGTLDELPGLVGKIDGGPAILIIGDVVAHSAPWRQSEPRPTRSHIFRSLPNDISAGTKDQDHRSLDRHRQPHLGWRQ